MPVISSDFLRTLPRKAQRRLPEKHAFKTEELVTGVVKKKTSTILVCSCGWTAALPIEYAYAIVTAMQDHLLDEAAKL
jgi:hypothetical protein